MRRSQTWLCHVHLNWSPKILTTHSSMWHFSRRCVIHSALFILFILFLLPFRHHWINQITRNSNRFKWHYSLIIFFFKYFIYLIIYMLNQTQRTCILNRWLRNLNCMHAKRDSSFAISLTTKRNWQLAKVKSPNWWPIKRSNS